jgi:hypothetical protein
MLNFGLVLERGSERGGVFNKPEEGVSLKLCFLQAEAWFEEIGAIRTHTTPVPWWILDLPSLS